MPQLDAQATASALLTRLSALTKEHNDKWTSQPRDANIDRINILQRALQQRQKLKACENPEYLEAALDVIDLEKIYAGVDVREAEQERNIKEGTLHGPEYGHSDFIVMETLRWYKQDFFKWVNTPEVEGKTGGRLIGRAAPTEEELRFGEASVVEVYQYDDGSRLRFPRFNNPVKLLSWRQGRCGEWNMCFYLILRTLDIRTRYVLNKEDHVWCEVWSSQMGRWCHVDSCEEAFDNPQLYNKGWGKKMSYCLAFGLDGVADVSKRYVVEKDKSLPRNECPEGLLKKAITWTNASIRKSLTQEQREILFVEDFFERLELNGELHQRTRTTTAPALPRQTGAGEWTKARGEAGSN
ncbi:CYFA0S41e00188g1_1 [Cyberlindnera fabianii]|uniref:Peptide:N-glycanase 1 n=1 Tax=Cyberlindnera fabianii TaxID=36022 RepID=A0A061BLR6_CYBFA|nr:CYFA0S41e00188g1_1 [Cyberlindnera fabianii]